MSILLSKNESNIYKDLENMFPIKKEDNLTYFTFSSNLIGYPESNKSIGNFFHCFSEIYTKRFFIGKSVVLLRSNFTKSFIKITHKVRK